MIVFIQRIVHNPRRSQQMGLQMAVSFSRRQFDPRQKSANGSLFQQETVCSLSSSRVYKWQSLPVEDSLFPKQLANGSLFPRKDSLSIKHSKRSTNGSFFKQFVCFRDV